MRFPRFPGLVPIHARHEDENIVGKTDAYLGKFGEGLGGTGQPRQQIDEWKAGHAVVMEHSLSSHKSAWLGLFLALSCGFRDL